MHDFVEVEFRSGRTGYFINPRGVELGPDELAIVEVERGEDIAYVVHSSLQSEELEEQLNNHKILKIIRKATEQDGQRLEDTIRREKEAELQFVELLKTQPFEMKLIEAIFQIDGNKVTFFFTSDGRVDFRNFVRELASRFRTRIELHQTSGRDEAKRLGGYGLCGYRYCCTSFLKKFNQVTIKMAKDQNLSNNLSKVSGPCGRLLCCLHFEENLYTERSKGFPELATEVRYNEQEMYVVKNDYYNKKVHLSTNDQQLIVVDIDTYIDEIKKTAKRKRLTPDE